MWGRAGSQTSPASAPAPGVFSLSLAETLGLSFTKSFIYVLIHPHTFTLATVLGPKNPLMVRLSRGVTWWEGSLGSMAPLSPAPRWQEKQVH